MRIRVAYEDEEESWCQLNDFELVHEKADENISEALFAKVDADINCLFSVPVKDKPPVLCEVQLHMQSVLDAKTLAHEQYEFIRSELARLCRDTSADVQVMMLFICRVSCKALLTHIVFVCRSPFRISSSSAWTRPNWMPQ